MEKNSPERLLALEPPAQAETGFGVALHHLHRIDIKFTSIDRSTHGQGAVRMGLIVVADIDFLQTDSEVEALLVESRLIKDAQPRYNVRMTDDNVYFSL